MEACLAISISEGSSGHLSGVVKHASCQTFVVGLDRTKLPRDSVGDIGHMKIQNTFSCVFIYVLNCVWG